jgi:predicted permease
MRPGHWLYTVPLRLRSLIRKQRVEQELDEELVYHIGREIEENVARGMNAEEARYAALRAMDGVQRRKEECRDTRRVMLVESTWQDLQYAIRGFRRSPAFVLTVVGTIALGLGLNTALFSIFNAYYFRPLPLREPQSLFEFYWTDRTGEGHDYTWPEYQEFLAENPAFSEALAYQETETRLDGRHELGVLVTGQYFQMLGVGATLGRTLLPEDSSTPGREAVIVLSYSAWQKQFAGAPDIIGRKLLLRGYPFEVVGVAPSGFIGLGSRPTDFWAPLTMAGRFGAGPDLFGPNHPSLLSIVGRLKAGVGSREAQAGLTVWAQRFTAGNSESGRAVGATLVSRATPKPFNPRNALAFFPILLAFALVQLIACANVANMMLARGMSRQKEIGIRLSLGATRGRLIRQLLAESLLLALPAAAAGLFVAQAATKLSIRVMLATLPPGIVEFVARIPRLSPDIRVFGFALAAALASALFFGLVPAMQATRADLLQAAKGDSTAKFRPSRLRDSLVVGQVTVCVLLLITAAVLLRGVNQMQILDARLSSRNAIEIVVHENIRARVLARLRSEPAVQILAAAHSAPVGRKSAILVSQGEGGGNFHVAVNSVSPEYFTIFEIPVLRGRSFTIEEALSGAPVTLISQSTAERLWPNQEAVGRSLRVVSEPNTEAGLQRHQEATVIGIVGDEISQWIAGGGDKTLVYFPTSPQAAGNELFVSVYGDSEAARRKIDAGLSAIDPNAVDVIRKIQIKEWVTDETYVFRVAYWGSLALGLFALLLTLSGIYGVLSYVVSERTREIGIRMAMGATPRKVSALVLKQSVRLGIMGIALGGTLALGVSKILGSVFLVISTFDAPAYVGCALLVLAACAAAAYFPSRRAAQIDPMVALRYD